MTREAPAPDRGRATLRYVAVVVAVALCSATLAVSLAIQHGQWPRLDWLAAMLLIAGLLSVGPPQVIGRTRVFASGIVVLASIPLSGPIGALAVTVVPVVVARSTPIKSTYNAAMRALTTLSGWGVYELLGGDVLSGEPMGRADIAALGVRLVAAGAAVAVVNMVLLAGIIRVSEGASALSTMVALSRTTIPGYVGYTAAAFLLVVLWAPVGLGPFAAILLVPSVMLVRWSLAQYVSLWDRRERILAALLASLEVRLPGARHQGEAVAELSGRLAEHMGRSPSEVEAVRNAALLRDVGLLAMPARDLHSTYPLDSAGRARMRAHPLDARRVLDGIGFLEDSLALIEAHHERMDGSGYPRGLVAEQIPLGARIIAVADAYVSFVSPISSRPPLSPREAITACTNGPERFDAEVVAALAHLALLGHVGEVGPVDAAERVPAGSASDHAHPGGLDVHHGDRP